VRHAATGGACRTGRGQALILSGLADPQTAGPLQEAQYRICVEATCSLARAFLRGGCDVAIDNVFEPVRV